MQFLSGVSYPLPTMHGFYIADSACGDGKTTMIVNIASLMKHSGILIIVQTTEAADTLYDTLCMTNAPTEICLLHSKSKAEAYMTEHRDNPTKLWQYPILIITAVRWQQYPLDLFVKFGALGNNYRGNILIDEIISFYPESSSDPQKLLPDISFITATKTSKKGKLVKEIKTDSKIAYLHLYKDPSVMEAGIKANPMQKDHFKNPLAKYRLRKMLEYISSAGKCELPPSNIGIVAANSTAILFDGTADVLFPNDKRLLSTGSLIPKYSSDITFEQFHLPFRRRNGSDWNFDDLKVLGDDLFNWIAKLTQSEKVLIITWKDIDKKVKNRTGDDIEAKEAFEFPDILSRLLDERGAIKANYGIIYRGSGLERGCNAYNDFETVIFLGEWFISDDITSKLNDFFLAKTTMKEYKKSLLIQSICRLRIRQHTGLPIKVFFSDDMDYNLIYEVKEYFITNSMGGCKISGVDKPIPKLQRHEKNHIFDIAVLCGKFPQLVNAFTAKSDLTIDIPKTELFRILPKDRKSIDRYKSLLGYLQSQGIIINII